MVSWALYDWANSAFATTVLAAFFPIFFRHFWNGNAADTTLKLGLGHAAVGLIVAVLAPTLGAIADRAGRRKFGILVFAAIGILATAGMALPGAGAWIFGLALFVVAMVGFAVGNAFYDSLLGDVCRPRQQDFVSALGYAFGYLGGGILFAFNIWLYHHLKDPADPSRAALAIRISFVTVAVWWALFSIPLFVFVHERRPVSPPPPGRALRATFRQLRGTLKQILESRSLWLFLLAYFCYIDGVNTIVKMALDYCLALKIVSTGDAMLALLLVQLVGFPAALAYGKLGARFGAKAGVFVGVMAYAALTIWSIFMRTRLEFYGLAVCLALVQGGVQALSRSLYSKLIPADRTAEYFGIYNILGKFESILGPALVGLTAHFGDKRLGIAALFPLFLIGGLLLLRVKVETPPADD